MFILIEVLQIQNIVLHLPINKSQKFYLLTKSNIMNIQNGMTAKEVREQWLKAAEQKLNNLKNSPTATEDDINYAKYVVALHINVLQDMNGMSY